MKYVYFLENQGVDDNRSNSKVFNVIQAMNIPEEQVFSDETPYDRSELQAMVEMLSEGDTLVIRSVVDLVGSINELLEMFNLLSDIGVELFSAEEPWLCGTEYADTLKSVVALLKHFAAQSRKENYQKALEEGRVGRPAKTEEVENALKLLETKQFSISQVEKLTGVSKTTIYKYLKEQEG